MVGLLLWLAVIAVALRSDTVAGRFLRRALIEIPAERLASLTPARLVFMGLVAIVGSLLVAFLKSDAALLLGPAIGEGVTWLAAFDVGVFVDVFALALMVAATVRLRAVFERIRSAAAWATRWCLDRLQTRITRPRRAGRSHRARRPPLPPSGEDERPRPQFAVA